MYFQLEVAYYSNEANRNKYKNVQFIARNWERQSKHEKDNNADKSDFSENKMPDLNSLKPF